MMISIDSYQHPPEDAENNITKLHYNFYYTVNQKIFLANFFLTHSVYVNKLLEYGQQKTVQASQSFHKSFYIII